MSVCDKEKPEYSKDQEIWDKHRTMGDGARNYNVTYNTGL